MLVAAKSEAALVAGDDASGDPKAEACTVEIFGGVKGLEEAALYGRRHAMAGIGDGDADARAALRILWRIVRSIVSADEETTSLTHGIDGVGEEIVKHLADVVFKA